MSGRAKLLTLFGLVFATWAAVFYVAWRLTGHG